MKAKEQKKEKQQDMFKTELEYILDLEHPLCKLAEKINWKKFEEDFAGYFPSPVGNTALPSRLVVGILYLKHAFGISDEKVVSQWVENPYWQYFCGMQYFQHEVPFHPTSLIKWRRRLGDKGSEKLLAELVEVAVKTKIINEKDLEKVITDTTVQEKAIAYPTDAKLQHKARILLLKEAKKQGLKLRQTYVKLSKRALFISSRYVAAKQMKRARKQFKLIKKYLGCVYRDIKRQIEKRPELKKHFTDLFNKTEKLLTQTKDGKNKLYSLHAPEVECIAKGKVHKKYEFGVKTSITTTHKSNFVVGVKAFEGNPYDGHTLKDALDQVEEITGIRPKDDYVDLGYRGHGEKECAVHMSRNKSVLKTAKLRRDMKRRSAVEPVIGHMKTDGLLGRNYLRGSLGDKINAILSGAGHNFRYILKKLMLLLAKIFSVFYTNFFIFFAWGNEIY
jgi:IS5 family transposase